jgi:hypothetical protein
MCLAAEDHCLLPTEDLYLIPDFVSSMQEGSLVREVHGAASPWVQVRHLCPALWP